jgi:hypothetical protein
MRRERAEADLAKWLYWRDYKRKHGPAAGIVVADELRRQVIAQRPDWPDSAERARDYRAHLELIHALARVTPRSR